MKTTLCDRGIGAKGIRRVGHPPGTQARRGTDLGKIKTGGLRKGRRKPAGTQQQKP